MATEVVKKPRKTTPKTQTAKVSVKIVNKHLKKVSRLDKLEFLPFLSINLANKDQFPKFTTVKEVGEFLDKHAMLYFNIPITDCENESTMTFPETSKDFLDMFFILNKKYDTLVVNQDLVITKNRYRSLGEIYLTFKFYYSKITWKLFLRTFFEKFGEQAKDCIMADGGELSMDGHSASYLSTLRCSTIQRRVFTINAISGRHLLGCTNMQNLDEFGFVLKDYLEYCK